MTDKEKLLKLLSEFGVGFREEGKSVICDEGMDKVEGYPGFFTEFEFDIDGKFLSMGGAAE